VKEACEKRASVESDMRNGLYEKVWRQWRKQVCRDAV
jgi:hypothetical protein